MVTVGESGLTSLSLAQATIWTTAGAEGLGFLPGGTDSSAEAASADGSVVVGVSNVNGGNVSEAFRWTQATGMQSIQDLLLADGISTAGWILTSVLGISPDGTIMFGTGIDPSGQTESWIADIPISQTPLPAALPLFATGLGGLGLLGWRRKRKAQAVV
jgi:probable HAF family extracellular repeat protein